ncbi:hypothetical protein [Jatrophihabitans fulvus]
MKRLIVTAVCGATVLSAAVAAAPASADTVRAATRCTYTGALFPNPLPPSLYPKHGVLERTTQLTANRGSLWAGVAKDDSRQNLFGVITWRTGQKRPTLLGSFTHPRGNYPDTVTIAGITPKEVVVAAVKRPTSDLHVGYAWYRGARTEFSHAKNWNSVVPVGVADDGTIYGKAHSTSGHMYLVSWKHRLAPYRVIREMSPSGFQLDVVPNGTLVYRDRRPGTYARLTSGREVRLVSLTGSNEVSDFSVAAGSRWIGVSDGAIRAWDFRTAPSGSTVRPTVLLKRDTAKVEYTPVAAGPRGDLVFAGDRAWVRTPSGGIAPINGFAVGAISRYGSIAVSLLKDGQTHLARCR